MNTYYYRNACLRLNGNWMGEGLNTDTPAIVSVEHGRQVIEPDSRFL